MSVEISSNTDTIYINLLEEGIPVLRPTKGIHLGKSIYKVLPTSDYDPDDEIWEFPPTSIVLCEKQHDTNDETILVAKKLANSESIDS